MLKKVCNGCHREANDKDEADTAVLANQWLKDMGAYDGDSRLVRGGLVAHLSTEGAPDLFCPKCQGKAISYWTEKAFKVDAWGAQYKASIRNHQKDYFSKKNGPKAIVHDNQELPRLH
jgi:hypothetical protein